MATQYKRERGNRPANNPDSQNAKAFHLDIFVNPLDADAKDFLMKEIEAAIDEDLLAFPGSSDPVAYSVGRVRRNC